MGEKFVMENGVLVMSDEQMDKAFKFATQQAVEEAKLLGVPYTQIDENGKAYLQYPDGRREYDIEDNLTTQSDSDDDMEDWI